MEKNKFNDKLSQIRTKDLVILGPRIGLYKGV